MQLPNFVGGVFATCRAKSDEAYRRLVAKTIDFYAETLFNPQWGEQLRFAPGSILSIMMVFAGLDQGQAQAVWRPLLRLGPRLSAGFRSRVAACQRGADGSRNSGIRRCFGGFAGLVIADDRPGAPDGTISFGRETGGQAGQVLYAYQSQWLPAALLEPGQRGRLVDALLGASTHSGVSLHVNKGLAGARPEAIAAAKETPMNRAVADAFALVIAGAEGPPAYPGIVGHEPDAAKAETRAAAVTAAMDELRKLAPNPPPMFGRRISSSGMAGRPSGATITRGCARSRRSTIPDGLFVLHHGVGSEDWSEDGFSRAT